MSQRHPELQTLYISLSDMDDDVLSKCHAMVGTALGDFAKVVKAHINTALGKGPAAYGHFLHRWLQAPSELARSGKPNEKGQALVDINSVGWLVYMVFWNVFTQDEKNQVLQALVEDAHVVLRDSVFASPPPSARSKGLASARRDSEVKKGSNSSNASASVSALSPPRVARKACVQPRPQSQAHLRTHTHHIQPKNIGTSYGLDDAAATRLQQLPPDMQHLVLEALEIKRQSLASQHASPRITTTATTTKRFPSFTSKDQGFAATHKRPSYVSPFLNKNDNEFQMPPHAHAHVPISVYHQHQHQQPTLFGAHSGRWNKCVDEDQNDDDDDDDFDMSTARSVQSSKSFKSHHQVPQLSLPTSQSKGKGVLGTIGSMVSSFVSRRSDQDDHHDDDASSDVDNHQPEPEPEAEAEAEPEPELSEDSFEHVEENVQPQPQPQPPIVVRVEKVVMRCSGIKKNGDQCARKGQQFENDRYYCHQHVDQRI